MQKDIAEFSTTLIYINAYNITFFELFNSPLTFPSAVRQRIVQITECFMSSSEIEMEGPGM